MTEEVGPQRYRRRAWKTDARARRQTGPDLQHHGSGFYRCRWGIAEWRLPTLSALTDPHGATAPLSFQNRSVAVLTVAAGRPISDRLDTEP